MYGCDLYGNLGRWQAEAYRSTRLVVDTSLHSKHWTFDQALGLMVENTGMPVVLLQSEISRYICLPGQATKYYIGYTRIMNLHQQAIDELKDQFDLKDFHTKLLVIELCRWISWRR
jgi:uncharacterized protein (DUF885 family)